MHAAKTQQGNSGARKRVIHYLVRGYHVVKASDIVWQIFIAGPEQTPFYQGQFELEFKLDNFPFKGPIVSFKTKIYHPNVNEKG